MATVKDLRILEIYNLMSNIPVIWYVLSVQEKAINYVEINQNKSFNSSNYTWKRPSCS